jgi:hypothetical protein
MEEGDGSAVSLFAYAQDELKLSASCAAIAS